MTAPPYTSDDGHIVYGKCYASYVRSISDRDGDPDPYPDIDLLNGSVKFESVFDGSGARPALPLPATPRTKGIVISGDTYEVKNSNLVDKENREGVWLITSVDGIPLTWRATITLTDERNRVVLNASYIVTEAVWEVELDGRKVVNLPDLIPNPGALTPVEGSALRAAQQTLDEIRVLKGLIDNTKLGVDASAANALTYRNQAQGFRNEAEGFKSTASTQAGIATTRAGEALVSRNEAEGFKNTASTQAGVATTKAGEAQGFRNEAEGFKNAASTQAGIATTKAGESQGFRDEAEGFKNTASTQAGIATTKAGESQGFRNEAEGFKNTASTQAGIATTKAGESQGFRNEAEGFKNTASTQAGIATTKAGESKGFRNEAEGFKNQALAARLSWKGAWDSGTAYVERDVVSHGGSSWWAKQPSTGVEPVEGATWSLVASRGEKGEGITSAADLTGALTSAVNASEATVPDPNTEFATQYPLGTFVQDMVTGVNAIMAAVNLKADLDSNGKLPASQLPALAITEFLGTPASQAAMLALSGQRGDWCVRTDRGTQWILIDDNPAAIGSWREMVTPAAGVSSVAGRTGAVTLSKSDVGLSAVDNTSDLNKPISNAVSAALGTKAATDHTHPVGDLTASGTASSTTYLRGDGSWATPANTTYAVPSQAEAEAGTATTGRAFSAQRVAQAIDARAVARSGSAVTLWSGTQAQYAALAEATKNAAGFIAVITD